MGLMWNSTPHSYRGTKRRSHAYLRRQILVKELGNLAISSLILCPVLIVIQFRPRAHPSVKHGAIRFDHARLARLGQYLLVLRYQVRRLAGRGQTNIRHVQSFRVLCFEASVMIAVLAKHEHE